MVYDNVESQVRSLEALGINSDMYGPLLIPVLMDAKLCSYRICRLPFGLTSSPFLLSSTLIIHAHSYDNSDPDFASSFLKSLHVDDLTSGADNDSQAYKFFNTCKSRLVEASFHLRKFESNSESLEFMVNNRPSSNYVTKVLGLTWHKDTDIINFSMEELLSSVSSIPTKRELLRFSSEGLVSTCLFS